MRILFIHQNMPGQFGRLAVTLATDPANRVAFITRRSDRDLPGVLRTSYDLRLPPIDPKAAVGSNLYVQSLYGDAVVTSCRALLALGFKPDVIVGHPGWGELLFVKDLMPDTPLISYSEFYHDPAAPYFGGDPPRALDLEARMARRAGSAHLLLSLEAADRGWSPTRWQKSVHPVAYQDKIEVIFDGVDTDALRPNPGATFDLKDGRTLRKGDEILTYAARALEPTRGFPTFYRALPRLLARRPDIQVLIAGGEKPHYDAPPEGARSWLERLRNETPLDPSRVHFLGVLPHAQLVNLLQVSRLHVYLTTPTVLSWSMVDAMSVGCELLASETPPVAEMIQHGANGYLTAFGDPVVLAEDISRRLDDADRGTGRAARLFAEQHLSLEACLPAQLGLIKSLVNGVGDEPRATFDLPSLDSVHRRGMGK